MRLTDRLGLAEFRADDDDLATPLAFRVAGGQYKGQATPTIGERVHLRRDTDDTHDPCAKLVVTIGDVVLGYVPLYYARAVSRLLDARTRIVGTVERHLLVPEDRGRWVVRIQAEPRAQDVAAESPRRIKARPGCGAGKIATSSDGGEPRDSGRSGRMVRRSRADSRSTSCGTREAGRAVVA